MKAKYKKFFKFWIPPILWAGVIFAFSAYPTKETSEIYWQDFIVKKTAHLVEYAILATLLYRVLKPKYGELRAGYLAIIISFFYAISDEYHQSFTPGREATVRDVIIDTIGAVAGINIVWKYFPKAPKRIKTWAEKLELI